MLCPKCLSENTDTSKFCNNCGSSFGLDQNADFVPTKTLETPIQAISKGTLIAGKYRILEEIGRGGMGIVYKAEDTKLKRTVALKFLPHQWTSDAAARERFIHEAQAASALDHPQICTIYEIEETDDGRMYISMAFYEGESLRDRIKREPLKAEEAIDIASQIGQGMAKAHQKGIVHRDIKPANILMTKDGAAKIVDFGLAKLAGQVKLTREGTTIGTVAYMSPEQARGDAVDQRTDIWSLGVVLYEMLAGKLPFKGDFEQTLIHSILKSEPEPITKFRKDLPAGLENIIAKALSKNLSTRYQSMDDVVEDLKAVAEGLKPLRAKTGLFRGKVLGIKKVYAVAGMGCIIVLAALALLFLLPKRRQVYDSLAVLPLVNDSGDPNQDHIANGLTRGLIQDFYKISALGRVVESPTVMTYQKSPKPLKQIAKELKVKAIVEGAVQKSGSRIQLTVNVHDPAKKKRLGGDTFDRNYSEIEFLRKMLVQKVIEWIGAPLTPAEKELLAGGHQVIPEAQDLYYKAQNIYFSKDWGLKTAMTAIDYLKQATKLDPEFASAYADIGGIYNDLVGMSLLPEKEAFSEARKAVLRALELDDMLAGAHSTSGGLKLISDWDFTGAEAEMKRAIELAPANPNEKWAYIGYLNFIGRFDEAVAREKQIEESAPEVLEKLAYHYLCAGRYAEGLEEAKKAALRNPGLWNDNFLAMAYEKNGLYKEALALINKMMGDSGTTNDPWTYVARARAFALSGRGEEALETAEKLKTFLTEKNIDPSVQLASISIALGDQNQAFKYLNEAFKKHSSSILLIRSHPYFHGLRRDPRYPELLKEIGFEK